MLNYRSLIIPSDNSVLLEVLRTKLPRSMREQLHSKTQARAYFLLRMLRNDNCIVQLQEHLQQEYKAATTSKSAMEQALQLVQQLQTSCCDVNAPFKFRLPNFLGEYPIHSGEINSTIKQFNQLVEAYHARTNKVLNATELDKAYQNILCAIQQHYIGCNINSLWQLLGAMCSWSQSPIEHFLSNYSCLLSLATIPDKPTEMKSVSLSKTPVLVSQPILANKQTDEQPFSTTFDYKINNAGCIEQNSFYLSIHGFALKPGGHADALAKHIPDFLPWSQWQCSIRRQLSQLVDLPFDERFFYWLQTALQRLGIEFILLKESSSEFYVSPFLNQKTLLSTLNEEMVQSILQEQCLQVDIAIEATHLSIISRYLIKFLYRFQFNRGQALGIGANWGGVISDSNESGVDAFRFNDSQWGMQFRNLSAHRQGPAEAYMNAAIGVKYELGALLSNFEYMTQLQVSEHWDTVYNALVDNLVTDLFPEPAYFENQAYAKYRRHYVNTCTDDGLEYIESFYQPDTQGTYFNKGNEYKQTPMFRQAGSLLVEAFPRDIGSSGCSESLSVANPLWPLQLQYAQCASIGVRGHVIYDPIKPDGFIPDAFYGQVIREAEDVLVPFIGVIPKNFDKHFNQVELCASFVVRMLQSSRLMTYCPAFKAYYFAIATRFLPDMESKTPELPNHVSAEIKRKWDKLDKALHVSNRCAQVCQKVFFSLFKELIYSLYSLVKEDADLHYYFVALTNSSETFEPQSRATCERVLRELTTLKPLENGRKRLQYELVLNYLSELTHFYYPTPCDEVAKAIAEQARLHAKPLLALPEIKSYFSDLKQKYKVANISTKISPGLMHDALRYQNPSPSVIKDFYQVRHAINFPSGYRDLDGNQIVSPSSREKLFDKIVKAAGASVALMRRNKTLFSVLTQPFAQAYIAARQSYSLEEKYRIIKTISSGCEGFLYGLGLGATHTAISIPLAIYNGLFVEVVQESQKPNHALAISSAPSNESGVQIAAIMDIRDLLLELMVQSSDYESARTQLCTRLLRHVNKLYPIILSGYTTKKSKYVHILVDGFPLTIADWQRLCEPVISIENDENLQLMLHQNALQIDSVLLYALYECLTAVKCDDAPKEVITEVVDKHKLKDAQTALLATLVNYYSSNSEAKKRDISKYRFDGSALAKLKEKERGLRCIQTWINNALDIQWSLERLLPSLMDFYQMQLNQHTLTLIVSQLPDSIKAILHELFTNPGNATQIFNNYYLDSAQKTFLLACADCYKEITNKEKQTILLKQLQIGMVDSLLSPKAREHLKLVQFIEREWHHQLLSMDKVEPIVNEILKQSTSINYPIINELARLYKLALHNLKNPQAFDAFYRTALKIQKIHGTKNPLQDWLNVTMNSFINLLLNEVHWTQVNPVVNPLKDSEAVVHWLNNLVTCKNGIRELLTQQIEQADSYDLAVWRCNYIVRTLEASQQKPEYIRGTGMQKLLRHICQNTNTVTPTGEQKAKELSIAALCNYSITMQHALERVREKIPKDEFARPVELKLFGFQ